MPVSGLDKNNPPAQYTPFALSQWITDVVFSLNDGSAATPGLKFQSDQDTGLFRTTADEIGVSLGGSEVVRFLAAGLKINEITITTGTQAGAAPLTLPDLGGVTDEIVTLAATQTLTNKSFSAATLDDLILTGTPTGAGAVWTDLGQVLTADIDGGTLDSVVVGGASAAAGTFTTLTWTTAVGTVTEAQVSDLQSYLLPADIGVSVMAFDAALDAIGTVVKGDVIYGSAANVLSRLAIGTSGQVLAVSATGIVEWVAPDTPGAHNTSHQDAGADEISVLGLSGLLADDQHVLDVEVIAAVEADAGLDLAITAGTISGLTSLGVTGTGTFLADIVVTDGIEFTAIPADGEWSGDTSTLEAGTTIAKYELLYAAADSQMELADATGGSTSPATVLALEAKTLGQAIKVLNRGYITNTAWAWTVNGVIYLSATSGVLTQTPPAVSGDSVQVVGVATHADRMYFNPSFILIVV